jgi:hypothetical protein
MGPSPCKATNQPGFLQDELGLKLTCTAHTTTHNLSPTGALVLMPKLDRHAILYRLDSTDIYECFI